MFYNPPFFFSNSDHVGWRSGLPDTILEVDRPRTTSLKFGLNWPRGFRGEVETTGSIGSKLC
jgi:hypothetical protein